MNQQPVIPSGMVLVTKDEFFAALSADPRDIMPNIDAREYTLWQTRDRAVFGWSVPGWANPGGPKAWAIAKRKGAAA